MIKSINVTNKEETKEAIISIAQELIRRADDITNDLELVNSITIMSTIAACDVVNLDVTKNYTTRFEKKDSYGMEAKEIYFEEPIELSKNNIEEDIKIIEDNLFNIQKDMCLQLRISIENVLKVLNTKIKNEEEC